MERNNKKLAVYFNGRNVSEIFKILPLYEEENTNLDKHIDSLIVGLEGLDSSIPDDIEEFVAMLAVIYGLRTQTKRQDNVVVVKREVFKAIGISKSLAEKMENE